MGAIVPGVRVKLTNIDTGVIRQSETNLQGQYSVPMLPPGHYEANLHADGFVPITRSGIRLEVGEHLRLDFVLAVGTVETLLLVTGDSLNLQVSTSEIGSVIGERQVRDLPLNGRNFTQLTLLTPGASPLNTTQNADGSGTTQVGRIVIPTMNGQTGRSNLYLADGVLNLNAWTSVYTVAPVIDAIQEFKVQSHNDLAEYGQANGAIVDVVTKSGTNAWHGTAWWFHRNDNLDARNFFRAEVTPLAQNQFGGTLGGPILHNKTFVFAAYQGFRRRTPADQLYRVPTQANLAGDLNDWPMRIFDPHSGRVAPDGTTILRDPFPGNRLPASSLDEGFLEFAERTLPAPIEVGVGDFNQLDTTPTAMNQDEYSVRLDHQHGPGNLFWGRWAVQRATVSGSGGRQTLASATDNEPHIVGGTWVHTSGPSTVVQLQYNLSIPRRSWGNRFSTLPEGFPGSIGYSQSYYGFRSGEMLMPNIIVTDFFSGGETYNRYTYGKTHSVKFAFSKVKGNHQVKFGGELNQVYSDRFTNDHDSQFSSADTADPANPGTTGSPLASWLLDVPSRAGRRDFFKKLNGLQIWGIYVQDSWKVTPTLSLNLGLRYDYTHLPTIGSREDRVIYTGTYDFNQTFGGVYVLQDVPGSCDSLGSAPCIPTADGSLPAGVVASPTGKLMADWSDNWQPRFGFAYRLNNRTALRGSFGMFFDSWAGILQGNQALGHTWPDVGQRQSGNLNTPAPSQPLPGVSAKDPFQTGAFPEPTPYNSVAWYQDPNLKNAYSMQWNMGLQQKLPPNTLFTINYVGSGNRRTSSGSFYNVALRPGPGDPSERQPFPGIAPTYWEQSYGKSSYHALQAQVRGGFDHLVYIANYTWSKTMNTGCDGFYGTEGCQIQDPYHYNTNRSVAGHHLPHVFTAGVIYELPFGHGRFLTGHGILDSVLGGWQVNGILTLHSGRPFTVTMNGDNANTGNHNGYMRPDVVHDARFAEPTLNEWFDTAAFRAPALYSFGNAGRNILQADGRTNLDLSLFKGIPLPWREDLKLELRAEAFNVFNHADFAPPNSNLSSSRFGQVTSALQERQLQLGLKLVF